MEASTAGTSIKEAESDKSTLAGTSGSAEPVMSHAMSQGDSSASSPAAHEEAGQSRAAIAVSFPNQIQSQAAGGTAAVKGMDASGSGRATTQATQQAGHANVLHATTARTASSSAGQAGASVQDQSSPIPTRDPSVTYAAIDTDRSSASASNSSLASTSATTVRATFAALDAESGTNAATWIHAGRQQAEAGIQDPALGWVGVRAQMGPNGVHAALVPNSADAAQSLGSHLAGLNTYLAEQRTPVETLIVAAPEHSWEGQGMNQGGGQNPGQEADQGGYFGRQAEADSGTSVAAPASRSEAAAARAQPDPFSTNVTPGGLYISVMA
jgi:hypothetical protein